MISSSNSEMMFLKEGLLNISPGSVRFSVQPNVLEISRQYSGILCFNPSKMSDLNLAVGPVTAIVQSIELVLSNTGPAIDENPS